MEMLAAYDLKIYAFYDTVFFTAQLNACIKVKAHFFIAF